MDDYENCFVTKGCFGLPINCVNQRDCHILATYQTSADGDISFSISGQTSQSDQYFALGLSNDTQMGDDSVMLCYVFQGNANVGMAWNFDEPEKTSTPLDSPQEGLTNIKSAYTNGKLSCTFDRRHDTSITIPGGSENRNFNLSMPFHLMLAQGSANSKSNYSGPAYIVLNYHTERCVSEKEIFLDQYEPIPTKGKAPVVKTHGTLMVLAWMFFACIGTYTARYFKKNNICENVKIFGENVWFCIHQGCMYLTCLLSVTSILVILIDRGVHPLRPEQIKINPHALFGILTVILGSVQPCIASLGPPPPEERSSEEEPLIARSNSAQRSRRPFFNMVHHTIGYTAILLAISTMLLSTSLEPAMLESSSKILIGLFAMFFCTCHVVLTTANENQFHNVVFYGYLLTIIGIYCFAITLIVIICRNN